eukprot:651031-Rhodomonas_salina.1
MRTFGPRLSPRTSRRGLDVGACSKQRENIEQGKDADFSEANGNLTGKKENALGRAMGRRARTALRAMRFCRA